MDTRRLADNSRRFSPSRPSTCRRIAPFLCPLHLLALCPDCHLFADEPHHLSSRCAQASHGNSRGARVALFSFRIKLRDEMDTPSLFDASRRHEGTPTESTCCQDPRPLFSRQRLPRRPREPIQLPQSRTTHFGRLRAARRRRRTKGRPFFLWSRWTSDQGTTDDLSLLQNATQGGDGRPKVPRHVT